MRRSTPARAGGGDLASTARACGLRCRRRCAGSTSCSPRTPAVITAFSQGVNQSSAGTDKVNAIINCHLATGRIGKPGAGPFSVTGQPNAMGGREVGGFVNTLAAHIDLHDEPGRTAVQEFWDSPAIASKQGPKAVEMFERIHAGQDQGRVDHGDESGGQPAGCRQGQRDALERCEFVVVSDVMGNTDTAQLAHVLLPALAWGEKDGTVTNSDRTISRQRPFLPPPGEARADWRIVCDVARAMGFSRLRVRVAARGVPRARAAQRARERRQARVRSRRVGRHQRARSTRTGSPRAWPMTRVARIRARPDVRRRRDSCMPTAARASCRSRRAAPRTRRRAAFPLVLNTGRVRDHWHTMTRTGKSARLSAHMAEPYVEINTADALRFAVRDGELATLALRLGLDGGARAQRRRGARRHGVRAHPLEPRLRVGCARGRVDEPGGRSGLGRARAQAHAGVDRARSRPSGIGVMLTRSALPPPVDAVVDESAGREVRALRARRRPCARLVARGAAPARRAGRRARPTSTGSSTASPARHVYRAAWFVDDRLEGCIYFDRRPGAAGARAGSRGCFAARKLDAAARARRARGPRARRRGSGSAGVLVFRRRPQSDRRLRARAGRGRDAGRDRQAAQVRHELRLVRAGDPGIIIDGARAAAARFVKRSIRFVRNFARRSSSAIACRSTVTFGIRRVLGKVLGPMRSRAMRPY